jgi:hypothetical protein
MISCTCGVMISLDWLNQMDSNGSIWIPWNDSLPFPLPWQHGTMIQLRNSYQMAPCFGRRMHLMWPKVDIFLRLVLSSSLGTFSKGCFSELLWPNYFSLCFVCFFPRSFVVSEKMMEWGQKNMCFFSSLNKYVFCVLWGVGRGCWVEGYPAHSKSSFAKQ